MQWYTVLATTPKAAKYGEFLKEKASHTNVEVSVPLFSDEEMEALWSRAASEKARIDRPITLPVTILDRECKSWKEIAYFFDNVPRDILHPDRISKVVEVLTAFGSQWRRASKAGCVLTDMVQLASDKDVIVKYVPNATYTSRTATFREGFVSEAASFFWFEFVVTDTARIISMTSSGYDFENAVHSAFTTRADIFSLPGALRKLTAGAAIPPVGLPSKPMKCITLESTGQFMLVFDAYYKPASRTFPLVDSFTFHKIAADKVVLTCFQMTVAREHRPTLSVIGAFVSSLSSFTSVANTKAPATITLSKSGQLQLKGSHRMINIDVRVVYIVRNDEFATQELPEAEREAPSCKKAGQKTPTTNDTDEPLRLFWASVQQYYCPAQFISEALARYLPEGVVS